MGDTLNRLVAIFGEENVFAKPDFSSSAVGFKTMGSSLAPDFKVMVSKTDQVVELVKLARELSLPLIPVSSSGPHKSGGVDPNCPGSIIVDLSGMKKILHIDKRSRLALIEPGVTWEELNTEAAKQGLRIPQPLLPRKGKSIIAALLDREPMMSPKIQWNMTEPLRSMEIVWGTGDKIYSGMGGHRGDKKEHWENGTIPFTNAGPHQFDFLKMLTASQGTFGIVTWASVKLELAGVEEKPLYVEGKTFEELTDFLYKTLKFRFGDEITIFNRKSLAAILADDTMSMAAMEEKLSPWTAFVNVKWGGLRPTEKIIQQEEDLKDIAQENGLTISYPLAELPGAQVAHKILALDGTNDWKNKSTGDAKEIFFLTTMDRFPAQLKKAAETADLYGYSLSDCPVYLQPLHQGAAVHCHIVLPIPTGREPTREFKVMYDEMSRDLAGAGAFYSRPYGIWSDIVYAGNAEHTALTRKMKDIFDPSNIMNPGKLCF